MVRSAAPSSVDVTKGVMASSSRRMTLFGRGWGWADRDQRLRVLRTAVAVEIVINVGAGSFKRPVALRNIDLQILNPIGGLRALIHLDPDARPIGKHLALPVQRAAAGAVAQILG